VAFKNMKDKRIAAALIKKLYGPQRDPEQRMRRETVYILGKLGDTQALPTLHRALFDSDVKVQALSAQAVGRLADKSSIPHLTTLLLGPRRSHDHQVRTNAVISLGDIGGVKARSTLRKLIQGPSRDSCTTVRQTASDALKILLQP